MKAARHLISCLLFFISVSSSAQRKDSILLNQGWIPTTSNISASSLESLNKQLSREKNKALVVLQFETIPSAAIKNELVAAGIVLLDYLPNNAYTATITGNINARTLQNARVRAFITLTAQQKMHASLVGAQMPAWAVKQAGSVDIMLLFPKTFSTQEVLQLLKEKSIQVLSDELQSYQVLTIRIATNRLTEVAAFPFVLFLQPVMPDPEPLNFNNRWASGAVALNLPTALGGKGLNGEGVVIGIGDNADPQLHPDFSGRMINRSSSPHEGHGTHVSGIAAGAGIINENLRGYASRATIINQVYNGIIVNAPLYVQDHRMVLTNNSYSITGSVCEFFGIYNLGSYIIDQQAVTLPHLQHVFAAGNSGGANCPGYAPGFGNVVGGYQSAKNGITVGAGSLVGDLWPNSSKGPVRDGRIKPDITAMGAAVLSTYPTSSYNYDWGTSMAAPAVTGGLALLYQRYRQLHNGNDPASGLMKALLCNGAKDRGNAGPDFTHGFGFMDLTRSITMLEQGNYFATQVTQGQANTHTITVPANTARLKATLYWHDPPASLLSPQTLVNDLDLELSDPSGQSILPKVPDPRPGMMTAIAVNAADHLNNMEQVILENPAQGTYIIKVNGTRIAQNPNQQYFVVFDVIPVATELRFPLGNHNLVPGELVTIYWDVNGPLQTPFTIQWSTDNGSSWTNIATGLPATHRYYDWIVPSIISDQVKVRLIHEGTSVMSTSGSFSIIGVPAASLSATQCEGYIKLDWNPVAGATDYELMVLRGDEMQPVATTTASSYILTALSKDSTYWLAVRARFNGKAGRRSVAIARKPDNGNCSNNISDNDLKLDAFISPATGRKGTRSELKAAQPVTITVKNLDDVAISNFTVSYSVNGNAWINESVNTSVAAGAVYTHTFAAPFDFSATGTYLVKAAVRNNSPDPVAGNDTVSRIIRHVANPYIDLSSEFLDDLESAARKDYVSATTALDGLDRYDYEQSAVMGRLRTVIDSPFPYSGTKAITMDRTMYNTTQRSINYLTGTYNLSGYDAATDDIRLDFFYNNHGSNLVLENRVWIRGADTLPWVEVYNLGKQKQSGVYERSASIEVSDSLAAKGQQFSSSFQVRWSQSGISQAVNATLGHGISFDNIRLYKVFNDVMMLRVDTPNVVTCGLSNQTAVRVTVRNTSHSTLNNIPVKYAINNVWVSETIPSIPGNTTISYTFQTAADFSVPGLYDLVTVVSYPADSYRHNDTIANSVRVLPLITSFPHLENFENGEGGWYAEGVNSTWAYGTPASSKIKSAASGLRSWKTNLAGNHNDMERSVIYSPCYQLTGMTNPTLSFSIAYDLEDCGNVLCDGAWLEYTTDDKTWRRFSDTAYLFYDSTKNHWSTENFTRWHVVTIGLPKDVNRFRFRIAMFSDEGVNREGIAVDDIHIYDLVNKIYDSVTVSVPARPVSGNNWVHFTSDGSVIASVNPNNQSLGNTSAAAYIFNDSMRYVKDQYYPGRNLVIQPANANFNDSVSVRYYFLESEIMQLVNATNCAGCTPPASAYELGVAKYNDLDNAVENGTIADNLSGSWSFIPRSSIAIVPYDRGYYAEFKVKSMSEFWLNKIGFDFQIPHAVQLGSFTAQKQNADVLVAWSTAGELNVAYYEIEVARGNEQLQQNSFSLIGSVPAANAAQQNYQFTDAEAAKSAVRYYRLRIVFKDGSVAYSEVRPVVFSDEIEWIVFPNPSDGVFQLLFQKNEGEKIAARLMDAYGRTMKTFTITATGFVQKIPVDLSMSSAGIYLLQLHDGSKTRVYKLFRN